MYKPIRPDAFTVTAICVLVLLFAGTICGPLAKSNVFDRRILRITGNAGRSTDVANMQNLMDRGATAGYNVVAWDNPPPTLHTNPGSKVVSGIKELRSKADALGLSFIPMSLGQLTPSQNDLIHAEAFPVKGTKFVVHGGEARAVADTLVGLTNGGFEDNNGKAPAKWSLLSLAPAVNFFMDSTQKCPGTTGRYSIRIENPKDRSMKLRQNVALKPWRAYRLTVWIKTEGMSKSRDVGFEVRSGGRSLLKNRYARGVQPNQAWKLHAFDFNSLETNFAQVYLVITDAWTGIGKVWFDEAAIQEVGLYESIRRPTLPVVVKSENGTVYVEGRDYTIQTAAKTARHDQGRLLIPEGSAIQNGQTLRVDWYQMANVASDVPGASFCHQEVWDLLRQHSRATVDAFGGNLKGWFMKIHSEWRLAYWDPKCMTDHPWAGAYMGAVVTNHIKLIREVSGNPLIEPYHWSDMVDPFHHGEAKSYMYINGTPRASWLTLDPQAVIVNWNEGHKYESLKFFAGLDPKYPNVFFRSVCSFWSGSGPSGWLDAIDKLEKEGMKAGSVVGMMYTTWHADRDGGFSKIEAFAEEAKAAGRWGTGAYNPQPVGIVNRGLETIAMAPKLHVKGKNIQYHLPRNSKVRLDLVNAQGQVVRTLVNERHAAGMRNVDIETERVSAGVYFVRLDANGSRMVKKAMVF